jgi:hypothetical protein
MCPHSHSETCTVQQGAIAPKHNNVGNPYPLQSASRDTPTSSKYYTNQQYTESRPTLD